MKRAALAIIRAYQRTISPDHGYGRAIFRHAGCRFYPSCSAYAHEAILKYGVVRGGALAALRVCRCNPWSRGGNDPVR